uniref:Uncharacterized protein n=1 Tax=Compsopogon caeruleus TaxID=31354 RepID=A0A7S1XEU4_9RHOD|mmetsp:Transcript_18214/g.37998  ORF Transcript_18214/g.37998 Transcript_18214/m.37998 type:complete len:371 (+) Transcript_18214:191-1303(+)
MNMHSFPARDKSRWSAVPMGKSRRRMDVFIRSFVCLVLLFYFLEMERLDHTGEAGVLSRRFRELSMPTSHAFRNPSTAHQKWALDQLERLGAIFENRDVHFSGFIPALETRRYHNPEETRVLIQDWCSPNTKSPLSVIHPTPLVRYGSPVARLRSVFGGFSEASEKFNMVERVVTSRKIQSILDPECSRNALWLSSLMLKLSLQGHHVNLTCVVYSKRDLDQARLIFRRTNNVHVQLARDLKRSLQMSAELILLFDRFLDERLDWIQEAITYVASRGSKFALLTFSKERESPNYSPVFSWLLHFLSHLQDPPIAQKSKIFNLEYYPFCRWKPLETSPHNFDSPDGSSVQWFALYNSESLVPPHVHRSISK